MKTKAIPTRRKFSHEWDEIGYLYDKLLYWFYGQGSRHKAMPFCDRLERLLKKASPDHQAILGEECWSLIWEVRGNLRKAIAYREHEIELIRQLRRVAVGTPGEKYALDRYGLADLSDRLDLLAMLYHDAGDREKALKVLNESKRLCESHGIPFDGQDLLDDYRPAKAEAQEVSPNGA